MIVRAGTTNISVYFYIVQDASGTSPGEPVTGLLFSDIETGGSASYVRRGAARVDVTLVTLASASAVHNDGGFIAVDNTNMPGVYRCDYPDATFASGAFAPNTGQVILSIVVAPANNAVAAPILVDLNASQVQTGDSFARIGAGGAGLSAIPTIATVTNLTTNNDKTGYNVSSIDSNVIDTAQFANNAIDATVMGVDAIDASAFSQAAADKVWDTTVRLATDLNNSDAKYGGFVWYDDVAGSAGSTSYTNGTMTNPSNSEAAVRTLQGNLNLRRTWCVAGSTYVMGPSTTAVVFDGENYDLDLNARDISDNVYSNARDVVGVGTSTPATARPSFNNCRFGATATIPPCGNRHCVYNGTVTFGAAGNYDFIDGASGVPGAGATTFDIATPGATTTVTIRRWSGGLTLNNIDSFCTISVDIISGGTVTLTGADGTVHVRGMCDVDDQRTGSPTLVQTNVINQVTIATPTNITAGTIDTVLGSVGSVAGHTNQTGDSYALLNGADSEPVQGAPSHTASLAVKIATIFKFAVNKKTSTGTEIDVFNSDETTVDHKSTISDDTVTYTEGEYKTGP